MTELEALRALRAASTSDDTDALAVIDRMIATREESEAYEALPYTHFVEGVRFGAPYRSKNKSMEEAIADATWAVEDNHYAPIRIVDAEGLVLLDERGLDAARGAYLATRADGDTRA